MLSRIHTAALLGLILAGPAVADGPSAARHPVAPINVDTLTADSDFTVFMRKDMPEEVRREALRRLWRLMQLPVSCHELCSEPEPSASGFTLANSEKLTVPTQ